MIYPTVGVPFPGKYFNFTQVCRADFRTFEKNLDSLFKPHNVQVKIHRKLTVSMLLLAIVMTNLTSYVKI